jgi:glycosyltransferase involved in cell wall biosynthesis
MTALGIGLLVLPMAYAAVMVWLRGGWRSNEQVAISNKQWTGSRLLTAGESVAGEQEKGPLPKKDFIPDNCSPLTAHRSLTFSVLIAARNEAENLPQLLRDLAAQTLPAARFEVLIADDHSTDATAALVAAGAQETGFALRLIELPPAQTGKKAALQAALQAARAPWLVCTDADCRLGPNWLAAYAGCIARHPSVNFISGPVLLTGPDSFFTMLMGLEFAGLVGVGGACLARRQPTMCNGANLAYRRAAFDAVGGYLDNNHLASGDDEFLLHKIHAAFPARHIS